MNGRARRWLADHVVVIAAALVLAYLCAPLVVTLAYSFNDYTRSSSVWTGRLTLDHWRDPCRAPGACAALGTSVQVGLVSTALATLLGTAMALGLARGRLRRRGLVDLLVLLPIATPEVVLGSSLLTIFVQGFSRVGVELGWWTIVASHTMFVLSFVVVTVRARLQSLDPRLEEAAADLYAPPVAAFWRVTLPSILPGVVAAALLSFALSFDDVIITSFVSGEVATFPTWVYAAHLRGVPAEANVIGILVLAVAVACVALALLLGGREPRRRR